MGLQHWLAVILLLGSLVALLHLVRMEMTSRAEDEKVDDVEALPMEDTDHMPGIAIASSFCAAVLCLLLMMVVISLLECECHPFNPATEHDPYRGLVVP